MAIEHQQIISKDVAIALIAICFVAYNLLCAAAYAIFIYRKTGDMDQALDAIPRGGWFGITALLLAMGFFGLCVAVWPAVVWVAQ